MKAKTIIERFEDSYSPEPMSGCWIWTRALNCYGYGVMSVGRKAIGTRKLKKAHRLSYEIFKGEIPRDLTIDHLCNVRCCVNPSHLEVATLQENIARAYKRREELPQSDAQKRRKVYRQRKSGGQNLGKLVNNNHCKNGHPVNEQTIYVYPNGANDCRLCRAEANRRYKKKTKLSIIECRS